MNHATNWLSLKDGSTRHIYVYHDDPQTVVNWYHAIRCCKLHLLQVVSVHLIHKFIFSFFEVAYPSESESELLEHLSQDYIKEVRSLMQDGQDQLKNYFLTFRDSWAKQGQAPRTSTSAAGAPWREGNWCIMSICSAHMPRYTSTQPTSKRSISKIMKNVTTMNPKRAKYFLGTPALAF